jgi:hypothetical protein
MPLTIKNQINDWSKSTILLCDAIRCLLAQIRLLDESYSDVYISAFLAVEEKAYTKYEKTQEDSDYDEHIVDMKTLHDNLISISNKFSAIHTDGNSIENHFSDKEIGEVSSLIESAISLIPHFDLIASKVALVPNDELFIKSVLKQRAVFCYDSFVLISTLIHKYNLRVDAFNKSVEGTGLPTVMHVPEILIPKVNPNKVQI